MSERTKNLVNDSSSVRFFKRWAYFAFLLLSHVLSAQDILVLDSLKKRLIDNIDDSSKLLILNQLTSLTTNQDIHKADSLSILAFLLAQQIDNKKAYADALYNRCIIFHIKGEYDSAEIGYKELLVRREQLSDSLGYAGVLNNLAAIYSIKGLYPRALDYYLQSLTIKEKLGIKRGLGNTLNNIGNIHYYQKNYEKARGYYERSLLLEQEQNNTLGQSRSLGNLGLIFLDEGKFDSAKRYYQRAQKLLAPLVIDCQKLYTSNGLGQAYFYLKQYDSSKVWMNQAYQESLHCQDPVIKAASTEVLAKIFWNEKNFSKAEQLLIESLQTAQENLLAASIRDISRTLFEFYKEINQTEKALAYLEMHLAYADSLVNQEMTEKLTQMEMNYSFQKERDSIFYEQEKISLSYDSEIRKRKIIQASTWVIVGLLMILLFISYQYYKQKGQHARTQETINQELNRLLQRNKLLIREIHHRVKNNLQLITSLLNIQLRLISEPKAKSIIIDSQNRIQTMSLVHHTLYNEETKPFISLEPYLSKLLPDVIKSLTDTGKIQFGLIFENEDIQVQPEIGINIGLICNELITNSIKYAFSEEKSERPTIIIEVKRQEKEILFNYSDNGHGISNESTSTNFGALMIDSLVRSMEGKYTIESQSGFHFILTIPS